MEKVYVWYSGATDITGKNLIEGLTERLNPNVFEVSGGTSKPEDVDIVICYGTKTSENITFAPRVKVLNHPDSIRVNRNKLTALNTMLSADVKVPYFDKLPDACDDDDIIYPVIARTNYHQGGKGLAVCTSQGQVRDLMGVDSVGFGYIQELVSFKQEYRIHVFQDEVIRCAAKIPQRNPADSWKAVYMEKAERMALRNDVVLDETTANICLKAVVSDLTLPDLIVKSNKRGWCFTRIEATDIDIDLANAAKAAVKAIGLDFGAVDCALDYDGIAWVIEVNTGPGLQGGTLTSYLNTLEAYIKRSTTITDSYADGTVFATPTVTNNESDMNTKMAEMMNTMSQMATQMAEMAQRMNNG